MTATTTQPTSVPVLPAEDEAYVERIVRVFEEFGLTPIRKAFFGEDGQTCAVGAIRTQEHGGWIDAACDLDACVQSVFETGITYGFDGQKPLPPSGHGHDKRHHEYLRGYAVGQEIWRRLSEKGGGA